MVWWALPVFTLTLACAGVEFFKSAALWPVWTLTLALFGVDPLIRWADDARPARALTCIGIHHLVARTLPLFAFTLACAGVEVLKSGALFPVGTFTLARSGVDPLIRRASDVWLARALARLWVHGLVARTLPLFALALASVAVEVLIAGAPWLLGALALAGAGVESLVAGAGLALALAPTRVLVEDLQLAASGGAGTLAFARA